MCYHKQERLIPDARRHRNPQLAESEGQEPLLGGVVPCSADQVLLLAAATARSRRRELPGQLRSLSVVLLIGDPAVPREERAFGWLADSKAASRSV
jgi:hypothetical protein